MMEIPSPSMTKAELAGALLVERVLKEVANRYSDQITLALSGVPGSEAVQRQRALAKRLSEQFIVSAAKDLVLASGFTCLNAAERKVLHDVLVHGNATWLEPLFHAAGMNERDVVDLYQKLGLRPEDVPAATHGRDRP